MTKISFSELPNSISETLPTNSSAVIFDHVTLSAGFFIIAFNRFPSSSPIKRFELFVPKGETVNAEILLVKSSFFSNSLVGLNFEPNSSQS